jgi:hypothetical protein
MSTDPDDETVVRYCDPKRPGNTADVRAVDDRHCRLAGCARGRVLQRCAARGDRRRSRRAARHAAGRPVARDRGQQRSPTTRSCARRSIAARPLAPRATRERRLRGGQKRFRHFSPSAGVVPVRRYHRQRVPTAKRAGCVSRCACIHKVRRDGRASSIRSFDHEEMQARHRHRRHLGRLKSTHKQRIVSLKGALIDLPAWATSRGP